MEPGSPKTRALLDLWAAHKELSAVEAREARQTVLAATAYVGAAAGALLVGWCALNAALVVWIASPFDALCVVGGLHSIAAGAAAWKARSLLRRPLFELTRREVARDSRTLFELVS
ncbi:MAG TPA: phage holin family protein [Byssovorax sp.]|jgi:uncharacterized membrane protein YqjE